MNRQCGGVFSFAKAELSKLGRTVRATRFPSFAKEGNTLQHCGLIPGTSTPYESESSRFVGTRNVDRTSAMQESEQLFLHRSVEFVDDK